MELSEFKSHFKKLVYQKGLITSHDNWLRKLHRYDNDDSHKDAILKALDKRDVLNDRFNTMLMGKTFDNWKNIIKRLPTLNSQLNKLDEKKGEILDEIYRLINF